MRLLPPAATSQADPPKQDEGDPPISSTLEPASFQPPSPQTAPPYVKIEAEWMNGGGEERARAAAFGEFAVRMRPPARRNGEAGFFTCA
ncbi:hypothetical protein SKAU_G00111470 [Synaphobranchus kaupii]|uniref:Uncharacterized protein n=1 Tax=Synaphobranchus kaupii TaxID=118154 RepID=A0A9Q1J848_SYNKA|nr:hypothetical protein SKAU_G00111470 [Synaphobranchus kaupii]